MNSGGTLSLQAADDEVPVRHLLEVAHEKRVDRPAPSRAEKRQGLRRDLLQTTMPKRPPDPPST